MIETMRQLDEPTHIVRYWKGKDMQTIKTILYIFGILIVVKLALAVIGGAATVATAPAKSTTKFPPKTESICRAQRDTAFFAANSRASGHTLEETLKVLDISTTGVNQEVINQMHMYLVPTVRAVYEASPLPAETVRDLIYESCITDKGE